MHQHILTIPDTLLDALLATAEAVVTDDGYTYQRSLLLGPFWRSLWDCLSVTRTASVRLQTSTGRQWTGYLTRHPDHIVAHTPERRGP